MNPNQSQTAFGLPSSFIPKTHLRPSQTARHAATSPQHRTTAVLKPKHVRRSEEIKRLTKQLEELRAVREQMKSKTSSPPAASPTPPPQPPLEKPAPPPVKPPTTPNPSSFKPGKHGEGSRFLSITDFPSDEYFPRIVPVAGAVPGLTVAQLEAAPRFLHSKQPELGRIYTTKLPKDYEGELIALPASDNISGYTEPIALKVEPKELSPAQLPCADDDYVYVILERSTADSDFESNKFYAWDVDGMVKVGWAKQQPAEGEARCLGRVIIGTLEIRDELRKKKSCWEEENEAYG